ncbi:MAG: peptide chain release factor RF1 [Candidatus Westeberhardia cardiocondylae]|nr:peptide chain release factor RF1 [Candidatus Westeberhardia cardiocondylae]
MFSKLEMLKKRYKEIEISFSNPDVMCDSKKIQILSKEYAKLNKIMLCFQSWNQCQKDIVDAKKMLFDSELRDSVVEILEEFYENRKILEEKLCFFLSLRNSKVKYGCFLEIRAASGGKEAALFVNTLFRMYSRFSYIRGWKIEMLRNTCGEGGGYKEVVARISDKGSYDLLQFESGGHRVQRIPDTESQGRIHSSSCTVAVIPEIPCKLAKKIHLNDLRVDTFRSSGAGGQHVNTTDSAIRITHLPTGIVVECQDERSQHKNKAKALSMLSSKLYAKEKNRIKREESIKRKNLIGTGDRSDRIRTYNFPKKRITDHRLGLTLYCLEKIIEGKLETLIYPMIQKKKFG